MNRTICLIGLFLCCSWLCAQTENPDADLSSTSSHPSAERNVTDEPITIIHLPDRNGELVPTFGGITYDEFKDFLEQRFARSKDARPQNIEIKSLNLAGVANDDHASLTVVLIIGTTQRSNESDNWMRIPFLFGGCALTSEPTVSNGGSCSVFRRSDGGYDFWIRSSGSESYEIKFEMVSPLSIVGDVTKMQINVPPAAVSELSLKIPEAVTAEFTNVVTDSIQINDNATTLQATGLSKTVGVSWKRGEFSSQQSMVRLEARGDVRCTVERLGVVTSDVGLQLKSFGAAIDRFVVRIPQSSTPISGDQPNYTMRELATNEGGGKLVEFKLNSASKEPPEIRFRLETNVSEAVSKDAQSAFDIATIEVMDAFRQYGQVELYSRADLKISWEADDARRVGNLEPTERDASSRLIAVFEYTKQPCRIRVNVKEQQSRVTVEPIHVLTVHSDRLSLESQFNYSIRGARATEFEFEFGNWEPQSIRSPLLREEFDFAKAGTGANIILGEPVGDSLVVESTTSRSLEGSSARIELLLPRAAAEFTSSGFLLIDSSDNVELKFSPDAIPGFRPTRIPSDLAESYPDSKYYCFRVIDDQQNPRPFPLEYTVQSQEIDVRSETAISLGTSAAQIIQKIEYNVRYVPSTQVSLALPARIVERFFEADGNDFFVTMNGQPVTLDVPDRRISDSDVTVTVALGETMLGRISIQLEYAWPLEESDAFVSQLKIPLVSVADHETISNSLLVSSTSGVTIIGIQGNENWLEEGSDDSEPEYTFKASSTTPETFLVISVNQPDDVTTDIDESAIPTIVKRAWIQSLFNVSDRNDRAVFQVSTIETQLRVRIPAAVDFGRMFVLVDRQEVKPEFTGQTLTIPIKSGLHTVEIFMPFASRQRVGSMSVELPEILDAKAHNMWQWLLVLPPNEHVLLNPDGLQAASAWIWTGSHWRRKNNMTQQQLEAWSNASEQPGPGGANQYLFNSFLRRSQIRINTANKRWLVGVGSGATLAFGLSMIYLRPVRKPLVLFLTAFALALCAYLLPDAATLLAQASIMGAVLAFIGQLLAFIIHRLAVSRASMPVVRRQTDSHTFSSMDNDVSNLSTAPFPNQSIPVVTSDSKS